MQGSKLQQQEQPVDRQLFGTHMQRAKCKPKALKPSENGYKVQKPQAREKILERTIRDLSNKICPEHFDRILERFTLLEITSLSELKKLVSLIFDKVLDEPHYCETYAKLIFCLEKTFPLFPSKEGSETAQNLKTVIRDAVQEQFETLSGEKDAAIADSMTAEEIDEHQAAQKKQALANMKFLGQLFLWELLPAKIIRLVLLELTEGTPKEVFIECACELLQAVGCTFDSTGTIASNRGLTGHEVVSECEARLRKLMHASGKSPYSKRIQIKVKDFQELRSNRWQVKVKKEEATTKDNVKKAAVAAEQTPDVTFSTKICGVKPAGIDALKAVKATQQHPKIKVHTMDLELQDPAMEAQQSLIDDNAEHQSQIMTEMVEDSPVFDEVRVKKLLSYFAEDHDTESFVQDWSKVSTEANRQGLEWLLEIGFNSVNGEGACAEAVAQLVINQVVSWEMLKDALKPQLVDLEDKLLDAPNADEFFHALLARLLLAQDEIKFQPVVLEALPSVPNQDCQLAWQLLLGALRKAEALGGAEAARAALDCSELVTAAHAAWGGEPPELAKLLQRGRLLE